MGHRGRPVEHETELLAVDDPLAKLPPVAQNILQAARRLLDQGGFDALRLQAIADEAGEAKGSIAYYFGNKAGLVAALVDCLAHDANLAVMEATGDLPAGERRIHALVDAETRIAADVGSFRAFFEILPHVLRDDELRPRVARLYEGYRDTVLRSLGDVGPERATRLRAHAMLTIAIVDGLAIQRSLDPDHVGIVAATELWERLLSASLAEAGGRGDPPGGAGQGEGA